MFKLEAPFRLSDDQLRVVDQLQRNFENPDGRVQSLDFDPGGSRSESLFRLQTKGNDKFKQTLLGVTGSGKTFVMANLIQRLQRPTLILAHNKTLAAQLYEEFKAFFPDSHVNYFISYYDYYQPEAYLPGKDIYIEKEADINKEIERYRLSSMHSVATQRESIVVASVSCIYNIGDPENYRKQGFRISVGDELPISELASKLAEFQYQRDQEDFVRGVFRVNGDIVDVFEPYADLPTRILFDMDEVEDIYTYDALTGKKIASSNEITIYPVKNFIFDKDTLRQATGEIRRELKERYDLLKNTGKLVEAERLKQRTEYDLEMLEEVGYCKGMENYSRFFEDRRSGEPPYTLMDFFPDDYLLIVDESHITLPQVAGMSNADKVRKETLIDYGFRLPSARDNRPLTFGEFRQRQGITLYTSATPALWEVEDSNRHVVQLLTRPTGLLDPEVVVRPTVGQIDDLIKEIKVRVENKQRVLVTTLTKNMAEDLSSYLADIDIKVYYLHSGQDAVERVDIINELRQGKYDVLVGINLLREGLDLPEVSLVAIMDADKEGFLRSKTSLIQTMGRAARHVDGKVILYADNITESMQYAISETRRRRKVQEAYNKKHGITPTSIRKELRQSLRKAEDNTDPAILADVKPDKKSINALIKELESKMYLASQNLRYEKAAEYRDRIQELRELL